jgi:hypothetical protein
MVRREDGVERRVRRGNEQRYKSCNYGYGLRVAVLIRDTGWEEASTIASTKTRYMGAIWTTG